VKDLEDLANAIKNWCIEIEMSADIMERSKMYRLYQCKKTEKELYDELSSHL